MSILANPQLSPDFDKARRLSRIMTFLFAIGFWVTLAWLVAVSVLLVWPESGSWGTIAGVLIPPASLSFGSRAGAIFAIFLGTVPLLLVLHHAGRVFAQFAKDEIFVTATILHVRSVGLWLVVSAFASAGEQIMFNIFAAISPIANDLDLRPLMLFFGVAVYVAAYIMAEARRIADDNASIV